MLKRWSVVWMVVLVSSALAACGGGEAPAETAETEVPQGRLSEPVTLEEAQEKEETTGETIYPLTVTDASGMEITFEKAPERVISIAPSETETLFAVGAGDRVIAVDDWSNYPEEAVADLPRVGGLEANIEKILELEPDLVVAGWTMSTATVEELRRLGITVYTFDTNSIDEAIAHVREVGKIMNTSEVAEVYALKMEEDRKRVAEAVGDVAESEKKRVYIEYSPGWTVGKGEYMDEIIVEAGGINIADQEGWYEISEEKVIEANPQVILYSSGVEGLYDIIMSRSGWEKIDAIVNGQVIGLDDDLISRPGPRITEALVEVAKALYPEKF